MNIALPLAVAPLPQLTDAQTGTVREVLRRVLQPKPGPISTASPLPMLPPNLSPKVSPKVSPAPIQAWVFGSRATGRARPFSDLDILLVAPQRLSRVQRTDLVDAFEASNLPFMVDVVELADLPSGYADRALAERRRLL